MSIRSEHDFLRLIDRCFPETSGEVVLGRGDDCAIFEPRGRLCVSTDLFLEDRHFRRSYFSPADIGFKALAVNISDIAGMGGRPTGFTLGLTAPPDISKKEWTELFTGMAEAAAPLNLPLTGGDLSTGDKLGLCITIWGEEAGHGFLRRGKVEPGDILFVCGPLGLARMGLQLLEKHGVDATRTHPLPVAAHLRPELRVRTGLTLAECGRVKALMDISDGLAMDLPRLLGKGVPPAELPANPACGADILLDERTVLPEAVEAARSLGTDPVSEAFSGGEDYGLLGAVAQSDRDAAIKACPEIIPIGTATAQPEFILNSVPFKGTGFDHFSGS